MGLVAAKASRVTRSRNGNSIGLANLNY
jgi:hypothetical protein